MSNSFVVFITRNNRLLCNTSIFSLGMLLVSYLKLPVVSSDLSKPKFCCKNSGPLGAAIVMGMASRKEHFLSKIGFVESDYHNT